MRRPEPGFPPSPPTWVNWIPGRQDNLLLVVSHGSGRTGHRASGTRVFALEPQTSRLWELLVRCRFDEDAAQQQLQATHDGGAHDLAAFCRLLDRLGIIEAVRGQPPFRERSDLRLAPTLLPAAGATRRTGGARPHGTQVLSFTGPPHAQWSTRLGRLAGYGPAFYPMKVNLDVTARCNQRCRHCYFFSDDARTSAPTELRLDALTRLVDDLHDDGIRCVNLMGGEPFVHPDILELVEHIKSRGLYLSINTNGTLLDEAHLARLKRAGVDQLRVGLDGHDRRTYGTLRDAALFDTCVRNIQRAVALGLNIQINFTVARTNLAGLAPMIRLARRLGARTLSVKRINHIGRSREAQDRIGISPWHYLLLHLASRTFPAVTLATGVELGFTDLCDAPAYAHIDAAGDVHFCTQMVRDMPLGNVRDERLLALWHAPRFRQLFEQSRIGAPCRGCWFRSTCNAWRCRAEAYTASGNFFAGRRPCLRGELSQRLTSVARRRGAS